MHLCRSIRAARAVGSGAARAAATAVLTLLVLLCTATSAAPTPPATRLIRDGLAPTDPQIASSLPRYLQSRSARFVDWLSDGSMLIATRLGDTLQIHRVRSPLGMREQLTFAPDGVIAAAAPPTASDALIYVAARAGGGTQLFVQRLAEQPPGGQALQLQPQPQSQPLVGGGYEDDLPSWSPDGARLAYVGAHRGAEDADVYLLDPRAPDAPPRLLAAGNGARWRIDGWSADGRRLLLGRLAPPDVANATDVFELAGPIGQRTPAALYIADLDSGTVTPVTAASPGGRGGLGGRGARRAHRAGRPTDATALLAAGVVSSAARFASDGHGLLLLAHDPGAGRAGDAIADSGHEYLRLVRLDPTDGRFETLSAPSSHDVQLFDASPDGRYIAYTLDENGASRLMLADQRLKLAVPVGSVPPGIISSLKFDATGKRLALTLESTHAAADVYVLDPGTATLTRWTRSETGLIDTQAFVDPEWLQFPTWDRPDGHSRQLVALGYSPGPGTPGTDAPRPVIIWLCSGAGAQCRPRFAPFVQYLVAQLGYVVIAPEVRGSPGQGASLQEAGDGRLRDDAVRDVGALLVWISLQPGLDRSRVALFGEGFGSYLALQSLTQYGDRVRGAVAAFLPALSGLTNVPAIRRPVLLVHDLGSRAAPAYQAAQLREGLRAQGVSVSYLAAADNGFMHHSARNAYYLAAANFLAGLLGR